MTPQAFRSAAPVVAIERLQLDHQMPAPLLPDHSVTVATYHDVMWLRECEAHVVLRHRQNTVMDVATYIDYTGFTTSVPAAVEHAQQLAASLQADASATLTVEVDLHVMDVPAIADPHENPSGIRKAYIAATGRLANGEPLEQRTVATHYGLWSSATADEATIARILAALHAAAGVTLPSKTP